MEEIYNSQNFRPNKQKVYKPPYLCYVLIILYSLYILLPLYIILITSVKTGKDASANQFLWWPVSGFSFNSYKMAFANDGAAILNGLFNTILYYLPTTICSVFVSLSAAYGFGKLDWHGKKEIFAFLLLTMMIPGEITMNSSRMYMSMLGWDNTAYPIIIPGLFGGIGTVFFLRQYVMGIPDDLLGAARIDGMSELKMFLTLIIPLTIPAVVTQIVLGFMGAYNSYLSVLIYLGNYPKLWTIQLVLKESMSKYPGQKYITMAYCTIGMFPLIIIYIFMQDFILRGTAITSGLKG